MLDSAHLATYWQRDPVIADDAALSVIKHDALN